MCVIAAWRSNFSSQLYVSRNRRVATHTRSEPQLTERQKIQYECIVVHGCIRNVILLFKFVHICSNNDNWSTFYAYTMQFCGRVCNHRPDLHLLSNDVGKKKRSGTYTNKHGCCCIYYSPAIPCYVYAVLACWAGIWYRHVLITCKRFAKTALITGAGSDAQSAQSRIYYLNRACTKSHSHFFSLQNMFAEFDWCRPCTERQNFWRIFLNWTTFYFLLAPEEYCIQS